MIRESDKQGCATPLVLLFLRASTYIIHPHTHTFFLLAFRVTTNKTAKASYHSQLLFAMKECTETNKRMILQAVAWISGTISVLSTTSSMLVEVVFSRSARVNLAILSSALRLFSAVAETWFAFRVVLFSKRASSVLSRSAGDLGTVTFSSN